MSTNGSEVWAGACLLLIILVGAALLLPAGFERHGAEWVALFDHAR